MVRCVFCDEPVNPFKPGTFSRQQGWTQTRKEGGAHTLTRPKALSEIAHSSCIEDEQWRNQKVKLLTVHEAECSECHKTIDPTQVGSWVEVVGWVGYRTKGGTNAVTLRKPTGQYLHKQCWAARHKDNQAELF